MNTENLLNLYEEVSDELKFHGISSTRTKIMISLNEEAKKTRDLREELGLTSSTILHGISELERQSLVFRRGDKYLLSQTGQILAPKIIDMINTLGVIKEYEKFWLNHEIRDIPNDLIMQIGNLNNSLLIEAEPTNIVKPLREFIGYLLKSKNIRALSPVCHKDFVESMRIMVDKDVKIELILTERIIDKIIKSNDLSIISIVVKMVKNKNHKLWVLKEDTTISFTAADTFLSLSLFSEKGGFDPTKVLISTDKDAIDWGNTLFEYYVKKAEKFKLKSILKDSIQSKSKI